MIKFIAGVIVGIVVSTTGVVGLAKWLDTGVETIKVESQKISK